MAYKLADKLVVAVASSALFDLTESDYVFKNEGKEKYRIYQRENENKVLQTGVAFPLIKRLLNLSSVSGERLVEVILFSRNDPDTGLRVFNSIDYYELPITRAIFVTGRNPFDYMSAFNASLFLSGNETDVKVAINHGLPAGHVVAKTQYENDETDAELRIAFDFDGVLADDSAERIFQTEDVDTYFQHETDHAHESLGAGPLYKFLKGIATIQQAEIKRAQQDKSYKRKLRIALCTARNAPALHRVVTTLRSWDVKIDEAFFLGGIEKIKVLEVYQPHIFFDDHIGHIKGVSKKFPSVHIPYGIANLTKD